MKILVALFAFIAISATSFAAITASTNATVTVTVIEGLTVEASATNATVEASANSTIAYPWSITFTLSGEPMHAYDYQILAPALTDGDITLDGVYGTTTGYVSTAFDGTGTIIYTVGGTGTTSGAAPVDGTIFTFGFDAYYTF